MPNRASSSDRSVEPTRSRTVLGWAAIVCYVIHAMVHLVRGEWYDLFWACHIAALLVGAGFLMQNAALNGAGVLLGLMGLPLWLADLAAGGEFFPTSVLTHVVALGIGLYGVARLGMPRGVWWRAALVLVGVITVSRLVTPPEPNVNVAFAIQHGWEQHFASHASYLAWMIGSATAYFLIVEQTLRLLIFAVQKRNQSTQPSGLPASSDSTSR